MISRGLHRRAWGRVSARDAVPHGVPFVVTWLAIVRIGAVAVPISTFSKAEELCDILARATRGH